MLWFLCTVHMYNQFSASEALKVYASEPLKVTVP